MDVVKSHRRSSGVIWDLCPQLCMWQCLKRFLIAGIGGGVLLASSDGRPKIQGCCSASYSIQDCPLQQSIIWPQVSTISTVRTSSFDSCFLCQNPHFCFCFQRNFLVYKCNCLKLAPSIDIFAMTKLMRCIPSNALCKVSSCLQYPEMAHFMLTLALSCSFQPGTLFLPSCFCGPSMPGLKALGRVTPKLRLT